MEVRINYLAKFITTQLGFKLSAANSNLMSALTYQLVDKVLHLHADTAGHHFSKLQGHG